MAPPMQNNLELVKMFIRANALRKLQKIRRRSHGDMFSMTKDDLNRIMTQMRKSIYDISRAEWIARSALVDQESYNAFMRGVPNDVAKMKLQLKLSFTFELYSNISKRRKPEANEKQENDAKKLKKEESFSDIPIYQEPLEKGQKRISDFFTKKKGYSGSPLIDAEIKEENEEKLPELDEEVVEMKCGKSKNEINLTPRYQTQVKKLLGTRLMKKTEKKEIANVCGKSVQWRLIKDLIPGEGISDKIIDVYSALLLLEAQKMNKNICILESNWIQVQMGASAKNKYRQVSKLRIGA
jgi:hypothetical protein